MNFLLCIVHMTVFPDTHLYNSHETLKKLQVLVKCSYILFMKIMFKIFGL